MKQTGMYSRAKTALNVVAVLTIWLTAAAAPAMINPRFTPVHLVKEASLIVALDVKAGEANGTFTATLTPAAFLTTNTTYTVRVTGGEHLPAVGPALLVTNRGLGVLEPTALSVAVRQECGRRLRILGTIGLPVVGDALRKLGSVDADPGDLGEIGRAHV